MLPWKYTHTCFQASKCFKKKGVYRDIKMQKGMFCIKFKTIPILNSPKSFLMVAKAQPSQKRANGLTQRMSKVPTLCPNRGTPKQDTKAGWQLDDHVELQIMHTIYITTRRRTMQMSSPFLSLDVTRFSTAAERTETRGGPITSARGLTSDTASSQTARAAG